MTLRLILLAVFSSPILAEALLSINISIPGFPLTAGRLSFILISFFVFISRFRYIKISYFYISVVLLLFGAFIGNFYSDNWSLNLITFYGNFLLFISAINFYPIFYDNDFKKIFSFFIILAFFYWIIYLFSNLFANGAGFSTYGELYRQDLLNDNENGLLNYHSFITIFSISSLYIYSKYFLKTKFSIIFIAFVLSIILISESRSNFAITALAFYFIYFLVSDFNLLDFIKTITGFLIVLFLAQFIIGAFDTLSWRYRFISDSLYYDQITESRFLFYTLTLEHLFNYPFGLGFTTNRVDLPGLDVSYQPHNQYLTFILQAGFFSLPIIFSIFKFLFFSVKSRILRKIEYFSFALVVFVTCIVNDLSGLNLFIAIALVQFLITYNNNEDSIPLSHSSN